MINKFLGSCRQPTVDTLNQPSGALYCELVLRTKLALYRHYME